ncbi:hypothetical protein E3N88_34999 [Mikania micrantha]|uniref:Uncharacterized protein n=1 Tax=Mikania micrantha TaxID=192012 RepID=A0A5N6LZQ8_9ASTR|nr:hypothetical protein E3N88_34999 [Mikania micrantha]
MSDSRFKSGHVSSIVAIRITTVRWVRQEVAGVGESAPGRRFRRPLLCVCLTAANRKRVAHYGAGFAVVEDGVAGRGDRWRVVAGGGATS